MTTPTFQTNAKLVKAYYDMTSRFCRENATFQTNTQRVKIGLSQKTPKMLEYVLYWPSCPVPIQLDHITAFLSYAAIAHACAVLLAYTHFLLRFKPQLYQI